MSTFVMIVVIHKVIGGNIDAKASCNSWIINAELEGLFCEIMWTTIEFMAWKKNHIHLKLHDELLIHALT